MRIRLIVGQYPQSYDGQLMPNVLDAWDEFVLEDNYEGFAEKLAEYESWVTKGDLEAVRVLDVIVPDIAVTGLFDIPQVPGEAVSE